MKTMELFSGTGSFSNVAREKGYKTFRIDKYHIDHQDLVADVRELSASHVPYQPEILWASPPCEGFSVAAIGKSWHHDNTPKSDTARLGLELVRHTWRLIDALEPVWWFIENPRGKLRKLPIMDRAPFRRTVTYCQYGDMRMKPTDIWTNAHWWTPRPPCKNGMSCHASAPRGSKTGTQGIRSYKDRARIPAALFEEMLEQYAVVKERKVAA